MWGWHWRGLQRIGFDVRPSPLAPCRFFTTPVSARAVHGSSDRLALMRGLATTLGFEAKPGLATKLENIRMLLTDRRLWNRGVNPKLCCSREDGSPFIRITAHKK